MTAPEVTPAAVPSPEGNASAFSLDRLRAWAASQGLSAQLLGNLIDPWIERASVATLGGALGFAPTLSALQFPGDPATLVRLKTGVEHGVLTGAAVTAYPDASQVHVMAAHRAAERFTTIAEEETALLAMPVTTFLAEHFIGRGGVLYDKEARIAEWAKLRWPTNGQTLSAVFTAVSHELGIDSGEWLDSLGNRTSAYETVHRAVYYDALPRQPLLRDVFGTATLTVTDVRQDVPKAAPLLKDDGTLRTEPQGSGLSFIRLLARDVSVLTPPAFLTLASAMSDPTRHDTYPDPTTFEWLGGIAPSFAAYGGSNSEGLVLGSGHSGNSGANNRVRFVAG